MRKSKITHRQNELVEAVAKKFEGMLVNSDIEFAVKTVIEILSEALENNRRIEIRGFGALSLRKRKLINQENFYNVVYFRMSNKLVKDINQINE